MNTKTFARKALLTTVLVGSLGGVGAGVASAAVTDASLVASTQSNYKAPCSYSAQATWNRDADRVTDYASIQNHELFSACRKTAVVTFVGQQGWEVTRSVELPTGAGKTDPTAPSDATVPLDVAGAVGGLAPFIDHIRVDVVNR